MPRKAITISQKKSLRKYARENPSLDQGALRQWFIEQYGQSISQSSISEILSRKYQDLDHRPSASNIQNVRRPYAQRRRWISLEAALQEWMVQRADSEVTPDEFRRIAQRLFKTIPEYRGQDLPNFSDKWLRNLITRIELQNSDSQNDVPDVSQIQASPTVLPPQTHDTPFTSQADEIYICVETRLYWKMIPEKLLCRVSHSQLRHKRTWVTALICTNLTGTDRLPIWYVGRNPAPHAFRTASCIPDARDMIWRHNKSVQLTKEILLEFIQAFHARMHGRKATILVIDPSVPELVAPSAHLLSQIKLNAEFDNIIIQGTSLEIHKRLGQSIIGIWKIYYRRLWMQHVLEQLGYRRNPLTSMNILKAVQWSSRSWRHCVTSRDIYNSAQQCGCVLNAKSGHKPREDSGIIKATTDLAEVMKHLCSISFISQAMSVVDFVNPPFEHLGNDASSGADENSVPSCNPFDVIEGDSDEETGP